jgi:hypothetical protein
MRSTATIPALTLLLLAGCAEEEVPRCGYADEPTEVSGVLESDYADCGYFSAAVGDHLYVNVYVTDDQTACDDALGEGLSLFASPTWSSFTGGGTKWTYDVVAEAASESFTTFDVSCDDGTLFSMRVLVQ